MARLREFVLQGVNQSVIIVCNKERRRLGVTLPEELLNLLEKPSEAGFSLVINDALE